jgi:hypothetical protein
MVDRHGLSGGGGLGGQLTFWLRGEALELESFGDFGSLLMAPTEVGMGSGQGHIVHRGGHWQHRQSLPTCLLVTSSFEMSGYWCASDLSDTCKRMSSTELLGLLVGMSFGITHRSLEEWLLQQ